MIQKVVRKTKLRDFSEVAENLTYWLSRTPEERVSAVEANRAHPSSPILFRNSFGVRNWPYCQQFL